MHDLSKRSVIDAAADVAPFEGAMPPMRDFLCPNCGQHLAFENSVCLSCGSALGITPQLLPAVVSASLATGSRRLAKLKVLVKRLVCITCASTTSLKPVALRMGDRLHRRRIA
jgi:hypothetical protein